MSRYAIQYAIIRFRPYVQTGEFANVGIVIAAPEMNYFDFRIETAPTARLTTFFDSLDAKLVGRVLQDCNAELERVRALTGHRGTGQSRLEQKPESAAEHLFAALTKDREGMIQYSDVRYAVDADPKALLDRLFNDYVSRTFAGAVAMT
jgi:hypothetical protein